MKTVTVIFEEPLHHVCLMHGLKQTYARMPFLNKKVLEVRGRAVTIDNVVAPPPMMKKPVRRTSMRTFVQYLIEDYLHFRHPFMKITIKDDKCHEQISGHLLAKIM